MKIINVKSFVALLLVLQIVLSPFSPQQQTKAEANSITENITHEFGMNTWAYNKLVNSPDGNLYLSHVKNRNEIVIKNWELGNWKEVASVTSSATGDTGFNGESDLVIDKQENTHFAFLFEKGTWLDSLRGIKYGVFKNGSWTFETVEANTDPWGGKNIFTPSMALDTNGKAHIVYRYNSSSPRLDEIKYATNQSGSWTIKTIASGANSKDEVRNPQIEVDQNNMIHITYVKEDNQNNRYDNYYYLHKSTTEPNFSSAEKIVDAISDQNSYTYTPFVVDSSGKIYFSYYKGNKWSMDIGNETFTTYFQTYQPGFSERKVLITDTEKITYPVQIQNSGSKSVLLMYTQSKASPPTEIEFFAMVKEGATWKKGPKEVIPSLINSNPSEITYNIDLNGNFMIAMLDNGLRKVSYLHPTDEDFGVFIESRNARLSNLTINEGAMEQEFHPLKTTYTKTVGFGVKNIKVTPTVADANATVTVNGTALPSGSPAAVPLYEGSNLITVNVTAEDGTSVKNYTMAVTRQAPSTNASLSNLTVSTGAFDQHFNPSITNYNMNVSNGIDSIGLTPTLADVKATVTVNGKGVNSGQELTSISLEPGNNPIPIVVTAEDGITTKTYTVDVQRNNTPVLSDISLTVDEGALSGTIVGTLPASDSDGDPLTYSILSGNTNNVFEMDASTGEIKVVESSLIDFETKQSYTLVIKVADGFDSTTANVTINVNDLNDNLPIPSGFSTSINENLATGASVGKVTTTDVDAGSNFTYVITSGNSEGAFSIDDNGEITVANSGKLDYETVTSFILTVEVSDGTNTATTTVTINLNNLNDNAPQVNDTQFSVDENAIIGTVVGTVSGNDADGDSLNYGIISGNELGAFTINPVTGEIIVINSSKLDYETQTTFVLKVEASDIMVPKMLLTPFGKMNAMFAFSANASNIATITINVNNLNDNSPVLQGFTKNIDENTANGTSVGQVTAVDADKDTNFTYRISEGNNEGAFAIGSNNGELTIADATRLDYETIKNFVITVEVSDGINTATTTVTINLMNVNEHTPILEDKQFTVDENAANGTLIGTISGIDADGDTLHYGIVSGNESGAFGINRVTGEIVVTDGTKLDYETQTKYILTVNASDTEVQPIQLSPFAVLTAMFTFNSAESDLATIIINVKNLNDNHPIPQGFTKNIDENTANGTSVGTVTAVDADGDTNFTYSILAGNSTGAFTLDSSSGVLKVANTLELDYEKLKGFTLTVQVNDGINTAETTVSINLNNVNDHKPVVEDAVFSVDENAPNGTVIGTVSGTDADHDALSYDIIPGNDSASFAIESSTGKITVTDTTKLDYETSKSFILTVKVSDRENTTDATVTVNLKNLNDNSPVGKDAEFAVVENAGNGTAVGTVEASDVDGDALHYSIVSGNESVAFTIDEATGEITVADLTKLDYETIKSFKLLAQVGDGTYTSQLAITVNLTNLNDNSPVGKDAVFIVDENVGNGTAVGTVEA
ncbi:MAG: calx-beta domain protein, partial [Neobacillus sp.]|nr:calx-beta domain protein [Neobacillus sp.]